jgi:uncharacterized protein YjlB
MKAAPMCFGLQGNHHQGATTSTLLKTQAWFNVDTEVVYAYTVHNTHATQVISCRRNTDNVCTSVSTLNQACIF